MKKVSVEELPEEYSGSMTLGRNLDGYRMWKDITAEDPSHRKLEDLFHAEDVFDPARPTPVPDM